MMDEVVRAWVQPPKTPMVKTKKSEPIMNFADFEPQEEAKIPVEPVASAASAAPAASAAKMEQENAVPVKVRTFAEPRFQLVMPLEKRPQFYTQKFCMCDDCAFSAIPGVASVFIKKRNGKKIIFFHPKCISSDIEIECSECACPVDLFAIRRGKKPNEPRADHYLCHDCLQQELSN